MDTLTTQVEKPEVGALIALPQGDDLEMLFRREKGLDPILTAITQRVKSEAFDIETVAGRKACKSLAFDVAKAKVMIENAAKGINADMAAKISQVNAERNRAVGILETLQHATKKPALDWDARDEKRKQDLQDRLKSLSAVGVGVKSTSAVIQAEIDRIKAIAMDDSWAEFFDVASDRMQSELERCDAFLQVATAREEAETRARDAELAREKAEEETRVLREQAAERDRAEAERNLALEREKAQEAEQRAEAERLKAAADKADADRQIKEMQDKLAGMQREKDEADLARQKAEDETRRKAEESEAAHKRLEQERFDLEEAKRVEAEKLAEQKRVQNEEAMLAKEREAAAKDRLTKARKSLIVDLQKIQPFTPEAVADFMLAGYMVDSEAS